MDEFYFPFIDVINISLLLMFITCYEKKFDNLTTNLSGSKL